jgi:ABC-type branched-chain amino acid transport systems, periplasmic component
MRAFALLTVILVTAIACQSGPNPSPNPDILIASDFPTSNPADPYATQREQAIQLAVNEQPRIRGFKLGYVPYDDFLGDAPSQARGVQNVKEMIADARVLGMIGPWTSNMTFAEIPVANAASLVMLGPALTNECTTVPDPSCGPGKPPWKYLSGSNNFFRIAAPEPLQGRALARYIGEILGVKRVAAFNELGVAGSRMITEFGDELVRSGGKLVLSRDLPEGTTSFKTFLDQAKAAGAQAIFAVADGGDHQCVARAQMAAKIFPKDTYFMGADGMVSWSGGTNEVATKDQCIKDAVGSGDGTLVASSDVDLTHNTDAVSMKAVAAYRKAYPKSSDIAAYTWAIYDCARLLIKAIDDAIQANNGGIPTRAQVVSAVAQTHFQGVTGTYSFDAHGDALSPMMSLYRVDNGHWVYVKPIDASAK